MKAVRLFALASLLVSTVLPSAEIADDDTTIIPGVRVGPILKGATLTSLKAIYGGGKVKPAKIPGAEGEEIDGASLFKGTDRELEVIFNPEGDEREVWDIRVIGKAWKFENGLRSGLSLEDVEKINGRPFKVWGFEWDMGGWADFTGGTLDARVSVRFETSAENLPESLMGDKQITSTDKKLRAAKPKVSEISVIFR